MFNKYRRAPDGRKPRCRTCTKAEAAEYYARPEVQARRAEYYETNREQILARKAEYNARPDVRRRHLESFATYYVENRDRIKAYKSEYYEANRDSILARDAEYAAANPHVAWKAGAVARAKRYGFDITVEDFTKADVINTYGNKCWHCGGPFEELDHYPVPCAHGGHHVIENVKPSCITCNAKGAGVRRANKPAADRKSND